MEISNLAKEEILELVDAEGALVFNTWYKNMFHYSNRMFTVVIVPDYRDELFREETLANMLCCEDYLSVSVYMGLEKPFQQRWYKKGDML